MAADTILYAAQLIGGTLYALFLEFVFKRHYEIRGHTWATVAGGVAMTGLIVLAYLLNTAAPALRPDDLEMRVWALWTFSFCASGVPIITWQLWVHDRNVDELRKLESE